MPPGYPASYERRLRLTDGRRVRVRPIRPTDAPALAVAIRDADAETLHLRFLGAPPRITGALLDSLTRVDYVHQFALVVFARRRGIALARYIELETGPGGTRTAEVAVTVDPAWRRLGLATALVQLLGERARECGIEEFSALYLAQNRPIAELADRAHARVHIAEGQAELSARLADSARHRRSPPG